jgi:hypothetical protein
MPRGGLPPNAASTLDTISPFVLPASVSRQSAGQWAAAAATWSQIDADDHDVGLLHALGNAGRRFGDAAAGLCFSQRRFAAADADDLPREFSLSKCQANGAADESDADNGYGIPAVHDDGPEGIFDR